MSYADDYAASALAKEAVEELSVDRQKRTVLLVISELDRGLAVAEAELREGSVEDALRTIRNCKQLVGEGDSLMHEVLALLRGQGRW